MEALLERPRSEKWKSQDKATQMDQKDARQHRRQRRCRLQNPSCSTHIFTEPERLEFDWWEQIHQVL